ncbi:MAG: FtsQ-type POTRA domain-containing protein [Bacilli bacterium]|nr:FtsQ-type POTRA domain-containing protein [Bacilli bacterium]
MAKRKKRKLKTKSVIILVAIITTILLVASFLMDVRINNVIVKGNNLFTDYEIIEKAHLEDYPSSLRNSSITIKRTLEKDIYIKSAKVHKTWIDKVVIEVEENTPLIYYLPSKKTILKDKSETDDNFPVPTVINYVPDKTYNLLLKKISSAKYEIIKRISEIKYDPNEVDDERFLLTMNDGNYVYITLEKFDKINQYLEILKSFDNKKGTLYLDSGEYFEVRG